MDLAEPGEEIGLASTPRQPVASRLTGPAEDGDSPSVRPMLRLVSTSSNTREFRTTSRSDRQCGCKNRISRPKKVAVRSAVSSQPDAGRSSTASRRYSQRTNNRMAMHAAIGRIQSAFDWMRPHSNVVRTAVGQQRQGGVRHAAPPCASATALRRMIAGRPGEDLLARSTARPARRAWLRRGCSRRSRRRPTETPRPARTDT